LIQKSAEFEAQLFTARAELNISNDQLAFLRDQFTEKQRQVLDVKLQIANPMILRLRNEIARGEQELLNEDPKRSQCNSI